MVLDARLDFLSNRLGKMVQSRNNLSQQAQHEVFSLLVCLDVGLWKRRGLELLLDDAGQLDEQLIVEQTKTLERGCVVLEEDKRRRVERSGQRNVEVAVGQRSKGLMLACAERDTGWDFCGVAWTG